MTPTLRQPLSNSTVLQILLIVPLLVWFAATISGIIKNEHEPLIRKSHPLVLFDKHVLRVYGNFIPVFTCAARLVLFQVLHGLAYVYKAQPFNIATLGTQSILGVLAIGAARMALYLLHMIFRWPLGGDIMSDHVILGASMVACLLMEVSCPEL
jgi:hypothetical protein